jgi:hypothetical protein
MGKTTDLRRAIKRNFAPYLEAKGFRADLRYMPQFLTFRRITPKRIYVCDIQWKKYGRPRFVLNFGSCGPDGVISHGEEIRPVDIMTSATPTQGRLMPGRHSTISGWFRQDRTLLQSLWKGSRLRSPDEVVNDLIVRFPEVDAYWESGIIGTHITVLPIRWSIDKVT